MQGWTACIFFFFFNSLSQAAVCNLDTGFEWPSFHLVSVSKRLQKLNSKSQKKNPRTNKKKSKNENISSQIYYLIFPAKLDITVVL